MGGQQDPATRTITDSNGRKVEIPNTVESIVCCGVGALRYTCYMQGQDLVVGVEDYETKAGMSRLYNYVNFDKFENLPVTGTNGEPFVEEIISVDPQVIVMSSYASVDADELQSKTGIPVVEVPGSDTTLDDKAYETIRIMGELYGKEERAEELTAYLKGIEADLADRTAGASGEDKPAVYVCGVSFKGAHGFEGTEAYYGPFELISANNLANTTDQTGAFAIIGLNIGAAGGLGSMAIPLCAFVGSIAVALVILGLSRFRQVSAQCIVLAGTAISAMFTGATTLMQYFADEIQLASLVYWTFGSLGSTGWRDIGVMTLILIGTSVWFFARRWDFNALLSGEETAASLGINVRRLTLSNMVLCCLLSAVIVSYIGLVSFIGLIAPHIVRLVVGNNHIYLLPGSIMMGGLILLLGDLFSRVVISPVILPIGAITSFLGGPMFLYLLFKGERGSHAEG